jgi:hypothetical protein
MMDGIVNLEILGHPINWLIVILLVVLIYFGAFAVYTRYMPASHEPKTEG